MTELESKQRTPLFHIVKRKSLPWYQAWAIRAAAIVLALEKTRLLDPERK